MSKKKEDGFKIIADSEERPPQAGGMVSPDAVARRGTISSDERSIATAYRRLGRAAEGS
jgi:hypothetical protein